MNTDDYVAQLSDEQLCCLVDDYAVYEELTASPDSSFLRISVSEIWDGDLSTFHLKAMVLYVQVLKAILRRHGIMNGRDRISSYDQSSSYTDFLKTWVKEHNE